tara:strand:- start:543 stop:749 length:207 start_codon:yes stop_codon:yes gene_type:complete
MRKYLRSKLFHSIVRWGLGLHSILHLIEFCINLFEGAYISACFTLLAGLLMLSGAMIDYHHHVEDNIK